MSSVDDTISNKLRRKKNSRLSGDVIGQLEDKLKENDLDVAVWLELIEKIEQKDKIEQVRSTYEKFLSKFPFLSNQWNNYVNYELNRGEFDKVENIFKRSLMDVSSVSLWKSYVSYIRRKNNLITGGEDARRVIIQAYDLAVDQVGIDPESGSLWDEYLKFIDDWKPISKWDEQQKMDMKRKIYKKALLIPLDNLEQLWSDYTSFENDLNTTTARKFISEISGGYMNARSWFKEWSNITHGLNRADDFIADSKDTLQLSAWRTWIKWELQNKLEMPKKVLVTRIDHVFKQAIQKLVFSTEIWFEYQQFYRENEEFFSSIQLEKLLNKSLLVNPTSFALNFKLIEIYEIDKNTTLVKKTFDNLIEKLSQIHQQKTELVEEVKQVLIEEVLNQKKLSLLEDEELKPLTEEEQTAIYNNNSEVGEITAEIKQLSKTITLTFCQYLKTIKRLEGLTEARAVFKTCRTSKKGSMTHHIFVEAGYLEYFAERKTKIALNVFELGLKPNFFANDGEYIYKYLKFLIKINDDANSKSLFETTINTKKDVIDPKWLKMIFKVYLKYESDFGQISSITKIEKRYNEIFPNDEKILEFADRYSFSDVILEGYQIDDDLIRFNDLKQDQIVFNSKNNKKRKIEDNDDGNEGGEGEDGIDAGSSQKKARIDNDGHPFQDGFNEESEVPILGGPELVTDEIYNLLRILPNASYFKQPLFNNSKLIKLLKELNN